MAKVNFKVGDRVKLIAEEYLDCPENPFWGGEEGKIIGTVLSIDEDIQPIIVKWDNEEENCYDGEDLELITEEDEMAEIEELKETIKKCSERLEKLEKKRESKYYLRLDGEDTAIGKGNITLFVVDENENTVDFPHLLTITEDGTLELENSVNPDIGLELDEDGCIVIQ